MIIGSQKAGSHAVARLLLEHSGLTLADVQVVDADWRQLAEKPDVDVAIVVTKVGSPDLVELLASGQFQLMALPNAWEFALDEPTFHPLKVTAAAYPKCGIPEVGIATVATTAFLAAQTDTPDVLVQEVLRNLYAPGMVEATGILSAERAAHWQGLAWHPAAREFFQPYRGSVTPTATLP